MKKTDLKKANLMMTPPVAAPADESATGSFVPANTVDQIGAQSMTSPKNTPQSVDMGFANNLDNEIPGANKEDFKAKIKSIQAKVAAQAQKGHEEEKCEKCGDVGHDMEKCWMGKSLNQVKKSEMKKDAFPLVDKSSLTKGKSLNQMKKDADMEGGGAMEMSEKKKMAKSSISARRADMASDQGIKPSAAGIVPNVKQDHITGVKTPMSPATPPKASVPSMPKAAPAAPPSGNRPKNLRPAAPKPNFGKVIMKSGMSLNDLKKAHDDYEDYDGDLDQPEHEPDHDDIFFHPTGPLGAHTAFSVEGKHKSTHKSDEEAHAAARDWSKANKTYPNAWNVSDHGNHHLIENFHAEEPKEAPKAKAEKAKAIVKKIKK